MDIILIPGFWLDGDSWNGVTPTLEAAGHTVHPLTLPGLESVDADRSGIGLRNQVDAVIAVIDSLPGQVVLVGHSGGGPIAHAATDARPDRISHVVYVDSWPLAHGRVINDELPVVDGEVPLPEWGFFDDEDLVDLTDELREQFRAIAIPEPVGVTNESQVLSDPRRYEIPVTVIACEFSSDLMRQWIAGGHPYVSELASITHYELVDLPTGHWPQFTKPRELAEAILMVVDR
jgi:pimeloyl-ACP methyl ester carboxylesterase